MQLIVRRVLALVAIAVAVGLTAAPARAEEGELTLRGVYYKERSTRVEQPMLDGVFEVGDHGTIDAHVLVDAITSASAASGAVDAAFSEKRVEAGGGYAHVLDELTLGISARYSTEPDYQSRFIGGRGQLELFEKNLTLGLSAGYGNDDVDNSGQPGMMRVSGTLDTVLASASAAQVLGANTLGSVVVDAIYLDGFQQNPYRRVTVAGGVMPEVHPDTRLRLAAAATIKRFVPRTETTVIASYRFYRDDWGIVAHTPELRMVQDMGSTAWFGASYRYHRQTAADFYQDSYAAAQPYLSADDKLARGTSHAFGGRLGVTGATFDLEGRWENARVEVMLEYYVQSASFGNATIAHAALTLPIEY